MSGSHRGARTRRSRVVPVAAVLLVLSLIAFLAVMFWPGETDNTIEADEEVGPLQAVAWQTARARDVENGGTLRLALPALPANFNPDHVANLEAPIRWLLSPTSGSAIRITDDGGWEVDENYAVSVEVVEQDPLQVEVVLNPEAVWQDGTPITVADMQSYAAALDGSDGDFLIGAAAGTTDGYANIESIEEGDDEFSYTVTFEEPTIDWPRYVYPALPESISSDPEAFNEGLVDIAPPSNGPFIVTDINRETGTINMEPNPEWWGNAPQLEAITWQAATEETQLAALANDELDMIDVPPSMSETIVDADLGNAQLQASAGTQWSHLTINGGRGALIERPVRRAISQALDRSVIAELNTEAVESPANVMGSYLLVPGQVGYTDQSDYIAYDPDAARALLDDAGWVLPEGGTVREKDGEPLELVFPVSENAAVSLARAQTIADQLAEVGIAVTIEEVPADEYLSDRISPLNFDLATFSYFGNPFPVIDAEGVFGPIDSPRNLSGLDDDEIGGLFNAAVDELDDTARAEAIAEIDRRLFDTLPLLPLGVVPEVRAVNEDLRNIGASQFRLPDWTLVGFAS